MLTSRWCKLAVSTAVDVNDVNDVNLAGATWQQLPKSSQNHKGHNQQRLCCGQVLARKFLAWPTLRGQLLARQWHARPALRASGPWATSGLSKMTLQCSFCPFLLQLQAALFSAMVILIWILACGSMLPIILIWTLARGSTWLALS